MARNKVRKIRHDTPVHGTSHKRARTSSHKERVVVLQAPGQSMYSKEHLIAKVSNLLVPTGREMTKTADKMVTIVVAGIGHQFAEGDLNIHDLGIFQAAKVKGKVKVTFTPAKKLEKCAEARLSIPQLPPPSSSEPQPAATPAPEPVSQSEPSPVSAPVPAPEPVLTPDPQPNPDPAPAPEPPPVSSSELSLEDVARGKQIMAPLSAQGYPASNAVDGNPDTKWVSGFNVPCWLNIQLGSAYRVKRIIARAPENLTMSYRIKGCIMGHSIQELIVVPNATGVMMWDNLDFVISIIEVWFDASSHPSQWVEFIELEVYGVPAQ